MSSEDDLDERSKKWSHHELEDEYIGHEKREGKAQRKIASAKDRSKYKKTDVKKNEKEKERQQVSKEDLTRGRVISIASEGIIVDANGVLYTCFLRGVLKKDKTQAKNLVVVGDYVHFSISSIDEGSIAYVEPRKSVLSRADNLSQRKEQLIASNIDQVLITVSVVKPLLKPSLVDRYIIATQMGGMTPIVLVNKIDLLDSDNKMDHDHIIKEKELLSIFVKDYTDAGFTIIPISCETKEGLEQLREVMKDKSSVFSGQSGVGKSSLINTVAGFNLKVSETVERTRKGSHTTTMASLFPLPFGGWCIDTPGIKSFGIWKLEKEEVKHYFFDIPGMTFDCKYPSCMHIHEPGCKVKEAVEGGLYSAMRYGSYLSLIVELETEHLRR
jgi:ribosome biogenesis GTPase